MTLNTLAIIPARGGSKGLPGKNIRLLAGKPLIAYAIDAIKHCNSIGRLIVSTDDQKIADIARKFGAEIPFLRPAELAQDKTPTIPVIEHALNWLENKENYKPDYILLVQPTSPLVKPHQIDEAFNLMIEKKGDSAITVVELPRPHHPYHVRHINTDGFLEFDNPEQHYLHPSRQMDPPRYAFANLYWFSRETFLKEKKIECGKRVPYPVDPASAIDINDQYDFDLAEFFLKRDK